MIRLVVRYLRALYRRHVLGRSLTWQGIVPWWVERSCTTYIAAGRKHQDE